MPMKALSGGDSGGAVFINNAGTWKLAGINLGVDGPWSYTGQNGTGFSADIFDARTLYIGGDGHWTQVPDGTDPIPASSYATRVSTSVTWIESVIVPEPATAALLLLAGGCSLYRRRQR